MSQTTPPTVDPLPSAPSTSAPTTFATLGDAFLSALLTFRTQLVALGSNVYSNAVDCYNNSVSAASSAATATTQANAAVSGVNAVVWTSGSYTDGQVRYSPSDRRTYRKIGSAGGATDPASDSANWILISNGVLPYLHVREEQVSGATGGSSVGADITQTRVLNTTKINTAGASLASNQITLLAGTYQCRIRVPSYSAGVNKGFLYNITDSVYTLIGSNESPNTAGASSNSFIVGQFTISGAKSFSIRHYTAASQSTNGLGNSCSSGQVEVFTEAEFWKVA